MACSDLGLIINTAKGLAGEWLHRRFSVVQRRVRWISLGPYT